MEPEVEWTDVMVDLETSGLNPQLNGIIQLSAIKFNLKEKLVGPVFNRFPMLLPQRLWSEDTRYFWRVQNAEVYAKIVAAQEPAEQVFRAFFDWIAADPQPPKTGIQMWAKPTHFDFPMLTSNMAQVGLPNPLHFRYTRDLNTYMAALNGNGDHTEWEEDVPFPQNGLPHDAFYDNVWQIDQLFAAQRDWESRQ